MLKYKKKVQGKKIYNIQDLIIYFEKRKKLLGL